MTCLKTNRLSLSSKYKAFIEVESGAKPSKVAEKHCFPRNTISTWLLPGKEKKKKIQLLFNLVRLAQKRKI